SQSDERQGRARAEVLQLFATPVAVAELPEPERINKPLAAAILKREAGQVTAGQTTAGQTTAGQATAGRDGRGDVPWSGNLLDWGGPAAAAVIEAGKALAGKLTCDRQGRAVGLDWQVDAWGQVDRSGEAVMPQSHPGAFWSALYIVDDGGLAGDPGLGGEIELHDPRGAAAALEPARLAFAGPGGLTLGGAETVDPRAGMLLLFPGWLEQGVRAWRGSAARISVSFTLAS